MGEMSNPVGDAVAWARDGARHDAEKLEKRIEQLTARVEHLESALTRTLQTLQTVAERLVRVEAR